MTYLKTLARAAGLGLCVAALSGTALADPGQGNGGPATTPPGQEQKAETPAASAPAAAPAPAPAPAPQASHGQEQKAENQAKQAEKKAAPKPTAKPATSNSTAAKAAAPGQAKKAEKQAEHKPAKAKPSTSKGRSADAHHHVIVCHRTGSESNPYVVINIPWTAWTEAHSPDTGSHPDLNGRHDILLKDPASRPGSKDGFDKSDCESAAGPAPSAPVTPSQHEKRDCPTVTRTETVVVGVLHATGAFNKDGTRKYVEISPSEFSAHIGGQHPDDKIDTRQVTTTVATGAKCDSDSPPTTQSPVTPSGQQPTVQPTAQPTAQPTVQPTAQAAAQPVGGVAGAVSPAAASEQPQQAEQAEQADKPAGGVLGAVASAPEAVAETATSGTLPFTGIPLWIAALIGGALLATGLVLRRSST